MTKKSESASPAPQLPLSPEATQPHFIYPYGPKLKISLTFAENGRTKQSFAQECDINNIMARYLKTGVLEHVRENVAQYLDVTGADFQEAQNLVAGANSMFHSLPSDIRTKFENSPREFLKFMENPANAQEAIALGLQAVPEESSYPSSEIFASAAPEAVEPNVGQSATAPSPTTPAPK